MPDTKTAGPVAVVVEPPPRRRRRPGLVRAVVVIAWTVFVALNLLVSGHWSMWLVFSLVPPLAFLVVSLAGVAVAVAVRSGRRTAVIATAVVGVVLAAPQSGLEPGVLMPAGQGGGTGTTRVVSWNTEYWDQTDDPAAFYGYLRNLNADVYLLQEYLDFVDGRIVPVDKLARIKAEFPDYQASVKGELVTLSRLAVVDQPAVDDANVLRVDVRTSDGTALSTYNVHIPAQLDPTQSPLSADFYRTLADRSTQRRRAYDALAGSADRDSQAGVIAGDFNTSPAMGEIRSASALGDDAAAAGHSVYPVSWNEHGVFRFWRLDWGFVRHGVTVRDYRLVEPGGRSDHAAQVMDIAVGGAR